MLSRRWTLYPIAIAILGLATLVGADNRGGTAPFIARSVQTARPLTLLEAWDIFDARAKTWKSNSGIASIASVDVEGDSISSGQDGRRRGWLAYIVNQANPPTELLVRLVDGVITQEIEQPAPAELIPFRAKPTLDSPNAVALALSARPNLQPSSEDIRGYSFMLEGANDTPPALKVGGQFNDKPGLVRLNANTGDFLNAQIYSWAPIGGILYSPDAGQTWHASDLTGRMVTAIYADPLIKNRSYAAAIQHDHIVIYKTENGGTTWSQLGNLPDQARDFAAALRVVYNSTHQEFFLVSTWTGVWVSSDGQSWAQAPGLPEGSAGWMGVVQSESGYRVFVDVTVGNVVGLYASTDHKSWTKIAEGNYRLSESFDRHQVLATDELQPTQSLLLSLQGQTPSSIPGQVLRASGDFSSPASMILVGVSSRQISFPNQNLYQKFDDDGASVVVSPDFKTSHIAVAGGFRSGIFRSTDIGRTWKRILANASEIVPGTNEIGDLIFVSPNFVIATNGGDQTWQDF